MKASIIILIMANKLPKNWPHTFLKEQTKTNLASTDQINGYTVPTIFESQKMLQSYQYSKLFTVIQTL